MKTTKRTKRTKRCLHAESADVDIVGNANWISVSMKKAKEAKEMLEDAYRCLGKCFRDGAYLMTRLDSNINDLGDTIDGLEGEWQNTKGRFDESGSESDGWFDDIGQLVKPIPGACVVDCSGSGRKDGEVDYWMRELGFDIGFPVAKAVQFLREFGAWDDLDLLADITKTSDRKKMSKWFRTNGNDEDLSKLMLDPAGFATKVLAQRVLWEFCNEIRDQAYETSEEDLESVGLSDDINDWDDEDWVKFQNELSYVSLNN